MGMFSLDGVQIDDAPDDVIPKCPSCKERLDRVWVKKQGVFGSGEKVFLCPHCHVWLGYSTTRV